MDDLHRKNEEQLNISETADFSVDDIVKEFGTAAEEEEETVKIWTPKPKTPPTEELLPPEPENAPEEAWEEEEAPPMPRLWQMPKIVVQTPAYESPEDAAEDYAVRCRRLRFGAALSWLLTVLAAAVVLVMSNPRWGLADVISVPVANIGTLAILLGHCVLALPVLRKGVEAPLQGKFSAATMVCALTLVTAIRGFANFGAQSLSLCAPVSLVLTVSLWGEYLLTSAKLRTVQTALETQDPAAAVRVQALWNGKDCLHRGKADFDGLVEDLEKTPAAEKVTNALCAIMTAAALAVAVVLRVRANREFLWVLSVLLLGTCPLGGILVYGRAFCLASRRLKTVGAALRGWVGAKHLGGDVGVVLTDTDIFPSANVSLNGIKVFGEESADRLLGYAVTILERSGATCVARLFTQALEAQNGRHYKLDNFRTYEAGGLGGEIGSDVVLLGGLGFMQTMGVEFPADTRLKQALYISLNGTVAGVFALNYKASDAVRSGLYALLGTRGITPILATGDTLLTPSMVRMKYALPVDRLEYPVSRERAALAAADAEGEQGAVLARSGFLAFAVTVCTAGQLRRSVRTATAIAVTGAVIGLLLMSLLTLVGAYDALGPLNLMLYHAIWLLPTGLVSGLIRKS